MLATGSAPKSLPGLDIDGERIITSEHALTMDRVPSSVIVLGGGVIGVEFASVCRSFGAEVTIVEALPHLLPAEEESSSKLLERAFRRRGIKYELGVFFEGVKTTDTGVVVTLANGKTLDAELLLVAVGRGAVSAGMGFEEAGVVIERGAVSVDEYCQTSVPGVYAVGDLIADPAARARRASPRASWWPSTSPGSTRRRSTTTACRGSPTPTPRSPRSASRPRRPRERGHRDRRVHSTTSRATPRARSSADAGRGQGHRARRTARSLGVHMVGRRIGELVTEGQLIYNWEALPAEVAQLIHAHPTQSEAVGEAMLALAGKPLHVHN